MVKNTLIFGFLLALAMNLVAANKIGTVAVMRGDVSVKARDGANRKLKLNGAVFVKDKVITAKGSFAKILMKDDTIITIGPNSEFVFETFDYKSKSNRVANYNLVKGKLRTLFTVKPKKDGQIKVKTYNTSMGVRGTEILTNVYSNNGKKNTDILLLSGAVDLNVKDAKGAGFKKFKLGSGLIFSSALAATKARPFVKVDATSLNGLRKNTDTMLQRVRPGQLKSGQPVKIEVPKTDNSSSFVNPKKSAMPLSTKGDVRPTKFKPAQVQMNEVMKKYSKDQVRRRKRRRRLDPPPVAPAPTGDGTRLPPPPDGSGTHNPPPPPPPEI